MNRILRAGLLAAFLVGSLSDALAQGTVLQGGPVGPGRVPMYSSPATSQPIVIDSGPASGGPAGVGLAELGITARGVGTPPYVAQGSGPFGTNACLYDAPVTNAAGYHYLCFSANAQGGGLLAYGAGGAATQLPFSFNINGVAYQFPFSASGSCGGVFVSGELCANAGASSAFPANVTLNALFNRVFGSTPNQLIYNSAGVWAALPSVANALFVTDGSGIPSWSVGFPAALLANPTGTIGLSAVNGVATTAMRSDAAPALSQAITPTWSNTHTFGNGTLAAQFNGPTAITTTGSGIPALAIGMTPTGSPTVVGSFYPYNSITIPSDNVNAANKLLTGLLIDQRFGGSLMQGGRAALYVQLTHNSVTSGSNPNHDAVAFTPSVQVSADDPGGYGYFTMNPVLSIGAGLTHVQGAIGMEMDIGVLSPTVTRIGINIVDTGVSSVQGTTWDAMIMLSKFTTATGFKYGMHFANYNGAQPISATGTLIGTSGPGTVANGADFSGYTFTTAAFKSAGFAVDGSGNVTALSFVVSTAADTLTLKRGPNGAVGTFICTSGGSIAVNNTFVAITDTIIISLNTAGGTVSNAPALNAITPATSFVAKCATSDTSTYNYAIIKNAS